MENMKKGAIYITIFLIFAVTLFATCFDFPAYFNQGVDYFNNFSAKGGPASGWNFKLIVPHIPDSAFKLGLDLQGGVHLVYQADLSGVEEKDRSSSMDGLRDVIERRVNLFGVQEPVVQLEGERLIIELAGIKNTNQAIKMIGETPYLEFKEQRPADELKKIEDKGKELEGKKTMEEIQQVPDWQVAFEDSFMSASTPLTGKYLKKAEVGFDNNTMKPMILLQFDDEGAKIFKELTARNIGKPLAIYLDYQLTQAPIVQVEIPDGKAQITGDFKVEEVKQRVRELNAGALPIPISLLSQQSVGPTLGAISLEKSLKAGMIGFLIVILFMIIFYRAPGLLASLALGIYVVLLLAIFKLIPVTLTLAGIGGFILSIGMAVDANVLIFSRMREELREGKSFGIAIEEGFNRAWPAIRDSNLTTLIVAFLLFTLGTSFVKGFAMTLSFGILLSMFSAIFVTKNFLKVFIETKLERIKWLWI